MTKSLFFRLDLATWPAGTPIPVQLRQINTTGSCNVSLLHALLNIARYTRPPRVLGFHLSDLWAWLRYFPAFIPGPDLKLREEWMSLDPHHKTIASGDFGVGFATQILSDILGFEQYVDVLHIVNVLNPGSFRLGRTTRRGPRKSPDYVAFGPGKQLSVLECKGSQTSHSAIATSVSNGKPQKANLHPQGFSFFISLVTGVFVPQWNSNEDALILVADPEPSSAIQDLKHFTKDEIGRAAIQAALSTDLALCSMLATSASIAQIPGSEDLQEALKQDLSSFPALSRREGDLIFRKEHIWEKPVVIGNKLIVGISFKAIVPVDLLAQIESSDPQKIAASQWAAFGEPIRASDVDEFSARVHTSTDIAFELVLLT